MFPQDNEWMASIERAELATAWLLPALHPFLLEKEHWCTMRYFLAIVLPPVAVFSTGRVFQGVLNIFLTILGWIPGVVHALWTVQDYKAEKRTDRIVREIRTMGRA